MKENDKHASRIVFGTLGIFASLALGSLAAQSQMDFDGRQGAPGGQGFVNSSGALAPSVTPKVVPQGHEEGCWNDPDCDYYRDPHRDPHRDPYGRRCSHGHGCSVDGSRYCSQGHSCFEEDPWDGGHGRDRCTHGHRCYGDSCDYGHRCRGRDNGWNWERVKQIAHEVEEAARHVHREAERQAHHGDSNERRALADLHGLEQAADHFHSQVERYRQDPYHTEQDYYRLNSAYDQARATIHYAHAYEHVLQDFRRVGNLIQELRRYYRGDHGNWGGGGHW